MISSLTSTFFILRAAKYANTVISTLIKAAAPIKVRGVFTVFTRTTPNNEKTILRRSAEKKLPRTEPIMLPASEIKKKRIANMRLSFPEVKPYMRKTTESQGFSENERKGGSAV